MKMNSVFVLVASFALFGCSSQPLVPEGKNIKIQREPVADDCENLGAVEGRNMDLKGNIESAIEDLRLEAAKRGANTVRLETTSGYGNSARGTAYICR
jgi:hypothetical protein